MTPSINWSVTKVFVEQPRLHRVCYQAERLQQIVKERTGKFPQTGAKPVFSQPIFTCRYFALWPCTLQTGNSKCTLHSAQKTLKTVRCTLNTYYTLYTEYFTLYALNTKFWKHQSEYWAWCTVQTKCAKSSNIPYRRKLRLFQADRVQPTKAGKTDEPFTPCRLPRGGLPLLTKLRWPSGAPGEASWGAWAGGQGSVKLRQAD